ncbi:MAG: hypothetical protein OXU83_07410 [Gammaproteobacteria bacterium]|nr:hypothetical protein [Gammaproteobacteria bacterium]
MKRQIAKAGLIPLIPLTLLLSACVTTGGFLGGSSGGLSVGPGVAINDEQAAAAGLPEGTPRLDVAVPVFNPGLPEDPDDYEEENVWPELRRAEANRFALQTKQALENTGVFGAVRVTPDAKATADLYVIGAIKESNGEDVAVQIEVVDISGRRWHRKTYKHRVKEAFFRDLRNEGKDPYQPVFTEAAADIAALLRKKRARELALLKSIADMRFAASYSPGAFGEHLERKGKTFQLASLPAADDPMLVRTRAIRVRDQLFVDRLQAHYDGFSIRMDESYSVWQKESFTEAKAAREAYRKAVVEGILGAVVAGLSIAMAANSDSSTHQGAAAAGALTGAALIAKSFQTRSEMKVHRDALAELGESIHADLAPQVIEFEDKTVELTGNAEQQFSQWRDYLKRIYRQEATPQVRI